MERGRDDLTSLLVPLAADAPSLCPAGSALVVETAQLAEDRPFPQSLTGLLNCRDSILVSPEVPSTYSGLNKVGSFDLCASISHACRPTVL